MKEQNEPPFDFDELPEEIADEIYGKMQRTILHAFCKFSNEDLQQSHANLMMEVGILLTRLNRNGFEINDEQKIVVEGMRKMFAMCLLELKQK